MYLPKNRLFASAFAVFAFTILPAAAVRAQTPVTLFNDTFSDNSPLQTGSLDMNWYAYGSGTMATVPSGPDYALQFTPTNSGSTFSLMLGVFNTGSGVQIGSTVGDYVQLSMNYVISGTMPASSGFRIGLYNAAGTNVTANGSSLSNSDFGYRVDTNYSGGTPIINKETGADASGPGGGSDAAPVTGGTGSSIGALVSSTNYTFTLKLARTLTGVSETTTLNNGVSNLYSYTGNDTTSPYTAFNEVVVAAGNAAPTNYTIDNVMITQQTAAPEAGSLCLLSVIGAPFAGIVALRRRRAA